MYLDLDIDDLPHGTQESPQPVLFHCPGDITNENGAHTNNPTADTFRTLLSKDQNNLCPHKGRKKKEGKA